MNKTININLGGIYFHIDEEAYNILKSYLTKIKTSIGGSAEEQKEILNDIEARISELLIEKHSDSRNVISLSDIEQIIETMGQPEDYEIEEDESTNTNSNTQNRKFYRDANDKFIGGVAAGSAHYIGIEPIWSRIIWLIIIFFSGVGIIPYIILWILLPQAKTTAEKLEMKGESVNIDNIEKTIREEFKNVSEKVKEGAQGFGKTFKKKRGLGSDSEAKANLKNVLNRVGDIFNILLKVAAKIIGIIIILISSIFIITLFIISLFWKSLESFGLQDYLTDVFDPVFNTTIPHWAIAVSCLLIVLIPFVHLFILGLRLLSKNKSVINKSVGISLSSIWVIAVLLITITVIEYKTRFNSEGVHLTKEKLEISQKDTLFIGMKKSKVNFSNNTVGDKKIYSNNLNLDIRKSDKEYAYIKIQRNAFGKNSSAANKNATKLNYGYTITDNSLELNNFFLSNISDSGFKSGVVSLILYFPEGQIIHLNQNTKHYLNNINNSQNLLDENMVNHTYKIDKNELNCLDCNN